MRQNPSNATTLTLEEYLAFEEQSDLRHEYLSGEFFAVSGASTCHNLITLNLVAALRPVARPRGCRTFAGDVKLKAAAHRIYYPDVMVACGKAAEVQLIVDAPMIIVEVTSPATRATDRREKLEAYQKIPGLQLYLIVDQRRRHVLAYSRADDGWLREEFSASSDVPVRPLAASIPLDAIYDDVPMPPLTVGEGEEDEWW
jgi:Uma2 family endonuclease